ncbi:Uncharacterised protein r2_g4313 [Pycnogonum litorale]
MSSCSVSSLLSPAAIPVEPPTTTSVNHQSTMQTPSPIPSVSPQSTAPTEEQWTNCATLLFLSLRKKYDALFNDNKTTKKKCISDHQNGHAQPRQYFLLGKTGK